MNKNFDIILVQSLEEWRGVEDCQNIIYTYGRRVNLKKSGAAYTCSRGTLNGVTVCKARRNICETRLVRGS